MGFSYHNNFLLALRYRHSKSLEEQYAGRTADFLLLWLFGAFGLLAVDFGLFQFSYTKQYFVPILGPSLCFMVVYVWSRRNPRGMQMVYSNIDVALSSYEFLGFIHFHCSLSSLGFPSIRPATR